MKRTKLTPISLVIMLTAATWGTVAYAEEGKGDKTLKTTVSEASEAAQQTFEDGWREGKLESAILFSDTLSIFDIDAEVRGNKAILTGIVKTPVEKQLAEEIALGVKGINSVDNAIVVDEKVKTKEISGSESVKSALSDATITAKVKMKLLSEDNVSALNFNVDTEGQVVTLSGKVPSEGVKELVGKIAENTTNVKSVSNTLVISGS